MTCASTIYDKEGLPDPLINTTARGDTGLFTFAQDSTNDALDVYFLETLNDTSISIDTVIGSTSFTATAEHGIVTGNIVEIADDKAFIQAEVVSVNVNTINIDSPINHVYLAGSLLIVSNKNMNVSATPTSPRIFSVVPNPTQAGDIVRIIASIFDGSAMDFSTFGGLSKLTNGCQLRKKLSNGDFLNLFNFKSNGDFTLHSFDGMFQSKSGGGEHAFVGRSTWGGQSKRGVVLRVDGNLGEEVQLVIQDDLTGLTDFLMVAQGHTTAETF